VITTAIDFFKKALPISLPYLKDTAIQYAMVLCSALVIAIMIAMCMLFVHEINEVVSAKRNNDMYKILEFRVDNENITKELKYFVRLQSLKTGIEIENQIDSETFDKIHLNKGSNVIVNYTKGNETIIRQLSDIYLYIIGTIGMTAFAIGGVAILVRLFSNYWDEYEICNVIVLTLIISIVLGLLILCCIRNIRNCENKIKTETVLIDTKSISESEVSGTRYWILAKRLSSDSETTHQKRFEVSKDDFNTIQENSTTQLNTVYSTLFGYKTIIEYKYLEKTLINIFKGTLIIVLLCCILTIIFGHYVPILMLYIEMRQAS
jgi:hypothetical protein